jgi:hypothetical protein
VFAGLGHAVDVVIGWTYRETLDLLTGVPKIRQVRGFPLRLDSENTTAPKLGAITKRRYDAAVVTYIAAQIKPSVKEWFHARRTFEFSNAWLRVGDPGCVEGVAQAAGWTGDLPKAVVQCSTRDFQLPPGTVALHPGCKPNWGFKRWHGFAELAAELKNVVVIGSETDLDTGGTYFGPFHWPANARILAGKLSLLDTAALLGQCALAISNDSGMFHLAAAVGTPSLAIFGPTVPQREAMHGSNVFTITKGLDCEPQCRKERPAGRSSCDREIECLRALTPAEVLDRVKTIAPGVLRGLP